MTIRSLLLLLAVTLITGCGGQPSNTETPVDHPANHTAAETPTPCAAAPCRTRERCRPRRRAMSRRTPPSNAPPPPWSSRTSRACARSAK